MEEFADFRKSKTLHGLIIEINALEEEGPSVHDSMRRLHAEEDGPIEIIAWRRFTFTWRSAAMPASMWRIWWKALS